MKTKELENLYHELYPSLFLYAFSLTHHYADAQDLVADAFVKGMLSFTKGSFKAWMYTVIKNDYYNLYKKKKRFVDEGQWDLARTEDSRDILKELIVDEQKRWLYTKIYELPSREQEVILLSIEDELDDKSIASIMNISIDNVRTIRRRAKQKLIRLCEKEGIS